MKYLKGKSWSEWTRDERFFCSELYHLAKKNVSEFAKWVCEKTNIPYSNDDKWDLGFEVCFYRDYFWQQNMSAKQESFPTKRTFDLCLFSDNKIIIIEAKVFESFETEQSKLFHDDIELFKRIPEFNNIDIYFVALASSTYFSNVSTYGRANVLEIFEKKYITWTELSILFNNNHILKRADFLYKSEPQFV